jgi:hypothetical protein
MLGKMEKRKGVALKSIRKMHQLSPSGVLANFQSSKQSLYSQGRKMAIALLEAKI